jgi:hypothetical protein
MLLVFAQAALIAGEGLESVGAHHPANHFKPRMYMNRITLIGAARCAGVAVAVFRNKAYFPF